jgi:uncharacterized protein
MSVQKKAFFITRLDPASYRRTPWKNGGGITVDIAEAYREGATPGAWEGMIWRFGRTAIMTPGPFSDLSGCDRVQAVVAGQGLVLVAPDHEIDVRRPFVPVRFAGETPIVSRLEAGAVEVVNLIGDRSRVSIDLSCLSGGATNTCPAGIHIIYAATSSCDLSINDRAYEIAAGHAMRIDAGESFTVASRLGTAIIAGIFSAVRTSG